MHEYDHAIQADELERLTLEYLRKTGRQITRPRSQIVRVLASKVDFATIDEVASDLEGKDIHRTTTYRTIELLRECGLVTSVTGENGAISVHLSIHTLSSGHGHVRCIRCQVLAVFPITILEKIRPQLYQETGYLIHELSGVCLDCSQPSHL